MPPRIALTVRSPGSEVGAPSRLAWMLRSSSSSARLRRSSALAPAPNAPSTSSEVASGSAAASSAHARIATTRRCSWGAVDVVGLHHGPCGQRGDLVVGAQEQVFLVGVEAVEGRLRDVRELGEIDDPHRRIALVGDQLDHRLLQALALVALDQLGIETVRAGGQRPVAIWPCSSVCRASAPLRAFDGDPSPSRRRMSDDYEPPF